MKNAGYIAYQMRELMKQGMIASLYTDPHNPDDFIAGYTRVVSQKTALIQSVGPYGRFDGWFGLRLACVIEIQTDPLYAERLERLLHINGEYCPPFPDALMDSGEGDHVALLLRHALHFGRVVTVWTQNDAYNGFVTALDDLHVTLELLDFMGIRQERVPLGILEIELLSMGSEEEEMFEKLNGMLRVK